MPMTRRPRDLTGPEPRAFHERSGLSGSRIVFAAVAMWLALGWPGDAGAQSSTLEPRPRPESYSRRVWQSSDGLPEDFTQALAQTADGYLWIGTSGGLARFDGVRFAAFSAANESAFRDDSVYSLLTTRDGTLWAGTEGGGLIRYRHGSFRVFAEAEGLTNPFVRIVFEDRGGRLWIGTDRGLFRFEHESLQRVDGRDGIPSMSVHAITEDRHGRLLVGGAGLLILTDGRASYYSSTESLADNSIRTIRETRDGSVWIGTIAGLRRLEGGVRGNPFATPRLVDSTNISVLCETRTDELWIGTYGSGLMRFDKGRILRLSAPGALPHNNVLALFEDGEGNVWVGTQGGMLRLQPGAATTVTPPDGTPLSISTIYEDPLGPVLVAALSGRLFQVARQMLVPFDLPANVSGLVVRNVFRDSQQRLWIGTDGQGVARIDRGSVERFTMKQGLVNDFARAFCEDRDGGLWIGTDGGLSHWRDGTFRSFTAATGLTYGSIRGLLCDGENVWIATERGLTRFRAGAFSRDPWLDRFNGIKVWALHQDADRGLWIGTQGAGLFLWKAGQLKQFTIGHGLPSNKIHFIGEDRRGNLWMSGPSGGVSVSRRDLESLDPQASSHVAVRLYDTTEGLTTNQMRGGVQPAGVVTTTGEIWFPSTKGAVLIAPDIPERPSRLPIVIEQVIADGNTLPFPGSLDLPPGEGKLEIQYTSIRLGAPERLRFRYWMEGFERDWTSAGQRRVAYYTNLPAGSYRFHVAAYETNAPQNATEQVVEIRLRPHLYETRWFLAICGVVLIAAAWGAYRLHVRNIRRQFGAVLQERNRLAREMHDTLIQGCVGVSTLLEAASHAQEVSPKLSHDLLDRARAEVRAAVEEARVAVWNLRHESASSEGLVPAVSHLVQRIQLDNGIEINVDVSGTPAPLDGEKERNVILFIREALQNAIRHAAAQRLSISLRFDSGRLNVAVEDNGLGFDCSLERLEQSQHFGLLGMRERVERMGGEFHLTSAHGAGTTVRLQIPIGRARL
jgi:signal transduction histidine kinase/ligand-binding sensor domain-containing protein